MQFPHLKDTAFPDLPTVDVYKFQNNFDYTRWNEHTKIVLCNVIWNSDYTDVVKWPSNEARDLWFDSIDDAMLVNMNMNARLMPDGFVKLPIPYDVMARYNYLFIDMPIATSDEYPIDYENSDGIRRWYFFINDIQYLSPNATHVNLVLDVWTNFQNDIDITYMLLERGHAPVSVTDTDAYLANPIANNRFLLAPDVNFDNAGITRSSSFVPFGNGTKYVCIATTAGDLMSQLGTISENWRYDPALEIAFGDVDERYGYQLSVRNYGMGNGFDYSNARVPVNPAYSHSTRLANNLMILCIEATECYGDGTFFQDVLEKCPQFLLTVKACFVVDENCIDIGSANVVLAGHTLHRCVGHASTLLNKQLEKSDFSYPQELQRFAKLYTAPYAQLEITDNDGNAYTVNIEETSTLKVKSITSVAFPYINERVYVEGIGGVGSQSYTWRDLYGNLHELGMQNSDWFKYCFDWEIPTFALFMDGETSFMLESFNRSVKQGRENALVAYHNSMRSANTAYENVIDQSNVAYSNTERNAQVGRDNSYRSADTGKANAFAAADAAKANADRSADTGKQNADASATTGRANAYRSAEAARDNAYDSADTTQTNANASANASYSNTDDDCTTRKGNLDLANAATKSNEENAMRYEQYIAGINRQMQTMLTAKANEMVKYTTQQNVESSTATAMNSAIGTIAGDVVSGAASGAVIGSHAGPYGAVGGGLIGALGGTINATVGMANNGVTTNTAQDIADKQIEVNSYNNALQAEALVTGGERFPQSVYYWKIQNRAEVLARNIQCSVDQMRESNETARGNADRTRDTQIDNAARTHGTARGNAARTSSTSKDNADATRDTTEANATRSQTAAKTNATTAQTVVKQNAERTQTTSRANASAAYAAAIASATATKNNVQANAAFTRQVSELNAKEILENGKNNVMAAIGDAKNNAPVELCQYSGNPTADYMRTRGIQIKVKTQSDSAIRQAGDTFARFGYALNQIWNVAESGLTLMQHFTYWKAAEIWVDDRKSSNNAINNFIHKLFLRGVTVWSDPDEIGRVNVYEN